MKPHSENDQFDIIVLLVRRKRLIITIFFCFFFFGIVYTLVVKNTTAVQSVLEIGVLRSVDGSVVSTENPVQVIERITHNGYVQSVTDIDRGNLSVSAYTPDDTRLVIVSVGTHNKNTGMQILREINTSIVSEHTQKFDGWQSTIRDNIKTTENQIRLLGDNFSGSGYGNTAVSDLVIALSKQKEQLAGSVQTRVVGEPVTVSHTNRILISLVMFIVSGLFVGIFVALGCEWLKKYQK